MEEFDYSKAIEELEKIAQTVENPDTALGDIDKLIKRADELVEQCRNHLRTINTNTSHII